MIHHKLFLDLMLEYRVISSMCWEYYVDHSDHVLMYIWLCPWKFDIRSTLSPFEKKLVARQARKVARQARNVDVHVVAIQVVAR